MDIHLLSQLNEVQHPKYYLKRKNLRDEKMDL